MSTAFEKSWNCIASEDRLAVLKHWIFRLDRYFSAVHDPTSFEICKFTTRLKASYTVAEIIDT